jgi:protein-tyrosine phosphatase
MVARRRLYRAEVLMPSGGSGPYPSVDDIDISALTKLGVRTVLDLRSAGEVTITPSAWADATGADRMLALPIDDGGHGAARDYVDMLVTGRLERFEPEHLGRHYIAVLEARGETFGRAVDAIAEGAPALVHCTEGKDRTGLVIAVVLGALGTPVRDIVSDYALTGLWRPDRALAYAPYFAAAGVALENYRVLYESPAIAMHMALEHLHREYGTVAEYLRRRGRVMDATLVQLRESLLDRASTAKPSTQAS